MTSIKPSNMSPSATSAARENANESIRKIQDSYDEREVDLNKKHREELQFVNNAHKDDMQKTRDQYEKSLREQKARSDDALNKQDMAYQKEIKDLKDMYQRKLEKMATNAKKETENGSEEA